MFRSMKKKRPAKRLTTPQAPSPGHERRWHNGAALEIHLHAESLRRAAKVLAERLTQETGLREDWDVTPVIVLYRHAAELYLKIVVGEGGKFLATPIDPLTIFQTRSLRWLAQLVCLVIKTVRWESKFTCDGIPDPSGFSALVNKLEEMEPISCVRLPQNRGRAGALPGPLHKSKVIELLPTFDALLDL